MQHPLTCCSLYISPSYMEDTKLLDSLLIVRILILMVESLILIIDDCIKNLHMIISWKYKAHLPLCISGVNIETFFSSNNWH